MKRIIKRDLGSDLREINIFVGLTLIIFFVAVGFPTLLNTSASFGYEDVNWTPVTTMYQEAYAYQEEMEKLAFLNYNPFVTSAFLAMPTTLDNPPPDPLQYFELKYSQPIEIEQGFAETVRPEMVVLKDVNLHFQLGSFVPISWQEVYYLVEKPVFENIYDDFSPLIPSAYGDSDIYAPIAQSNRYQNNVNSVSGTCSVTNSTSGGLIAGGGADVNHISSNSNGACFFTVFTINPQIPPDMIDTITSEVGALAHRGTMSIGDTNYDCGIAFLGGVPEPHGTFGAMTPDDIWFNATAKSAWTTNFNSALCRSSFGFEGTDTGYPARTVRVVDFIERFQSNLHPDGTLVCDPADDTDCRYSYAYIDNTLPNRQGSSKDASFIKEYFKIRVQPDTNNTDGNWQIKEHSFYPSGVMDDCNYTIFNNKLRIDSGATDAEQGQCLVFKTFHTGTEEFKDDFTNSFARTVADEFEWDTTDQPRFDINNVTGKLEIRVDDQNTNFDGIRIVIPELEKKWTIQIPYNATFTAGTAPEHEVWFVFGQVPSQVNPEGNALEDAVGLGWRVDSTGEGSQKRFLTSWMDSTTNAEIVTRSEFLNSTDLGSAMDDGCIEMIRNHHVGTWNFYDDISCTGTPLQTSTRSMLGSASRDIDQLDTLKFMYSDLNSVGTGSIDIDIDSIKLWKGVLEAPTPNFNPDISVFLNASGTGSSEMRVFVDVMDGTMDMGNIYSSGGTVTVTSGHMQENQLREDLGTGDNHRLGIIEVDLPFEGEILLKPEFSSGSETIFSVFVGLQDNSTDGTIILDINNVTVGTVFNNFTDNPTIRFHEQTNFANPSPIKAFLDTGYVSVNVTTVSGSVIMKNTGSLGSSADAVYFEDDIQSTFVINESGRINEAVIQNGTSSLDTNGEIYLGLTESSWDFLHRPNTGSNLTSVNMWINGDTVGSAFYPILTNQFQANGNGFQIGTDQGRLLLFLMQGGGNKFPTSINDFPIEPPDDGQWHMLSVAYDKGNVSAGAKKVCVDATCVTNAGSGSAWTATSVTALDPLTIGSDADHLTSGGVVENTWDIDDVTIWNGHELTQSDITTLYNSGSGVVGTTISPSNIVGYWSFDSSTGRGGEVTAPALPAPKNAITGGTVTSASSLDVDWIHDGINTTGYRIYRTSTEPVDTKVIYDTLGSEDFAEKINAVNVSVAHSGLSVVADEIISELVILIMNDTGMPVTSDGLIRGAIFADATTSTTSNATIALSVFPNGSSRVQTVDLPSGLTPFAFEFRRDGLVNLTSGFPTDIGFGVFRNSSFTGDVSVGLCTGGCAGAGSGRTFDTSVGGGTWLEIGATFDIPVRLTAINQTKLLSTAVPYINDTGSLDTNFTDTGTLLGSGHTYFYRVVPLNGDIEGDTVVILNGTEGYIINQTLSDVSIAVDEVTRGLFDARTYPDPVLYLDFEDENLNAELITNLGTYGSASDCVIQHETSGNMSATDVRNSTGLLGNSLIINRTINEGVEIECGLQDLSNIDELWTFLHTNDKTTPSNFGANLTSINMWVLGNFDIGTALDRKELIMTGSGSDGMEFMARNPDELVARVGDPIFNIGDDGQGIPDDGQWHMLSMLVNKTEPSGGTPMRMCLDSTNCVDFSYLSFPFTGVSNTTEGLLTIGENDFGMSIGTTEGVFNVDEVAIWKDHFLNSTELAFLYNGGNGTRVLQEPLPPILFNVSDTTTVSDQVNATLIPATIPDPVTGLTAVYNFTSGEIDLSWNASAGADSYRIYRTSTESGDEVVLYNFNGLGSPQTQTATSAPIDFGAEGNWSPSTLFQNQIVTRMTSNAMTSNDPTSGIARSVVLLNTQLGQGDDTILANSTTFIDTKLGAIPVDSVRTFRYYDDDLLNLTSTVTATPINLGIGFSFEKSRVGDTGTLAFRSGDGTGGQTPAQRRFDAGTPTWGQTNGQDLRGSIAVLNQTKLSADPQVNDTATTATTFSDTTVTGTINSYLYRVVGLNTGVEGGLSNVANATVIPPPDAITGLTGFFNETTQSIELDWDIGVGADSYRIYRTSTESGDEVIEYQETGGGTPQNFALIGSQGNWDGIAQNGDHFSGWAVDRWEGLIISKFQGGSGSNRCSNTFGLANGGFTTGSLFTNAMLSTSSDNSTIANSTNIILPEDWVNSTIGTGAVNYFYRGSDLLNITNGVNIPNQRLLGIGISWWDGTSGTLVCDTRANVGEGGGRFWDITPQIWTWINGQDLLATISVVNNTKLSADPEVNDTATSAVTFSDTNIDEASPAVGNTYFYRVVGLNANPNQGGFSSVINVTAVNATIPLNATVNITDTVEAIDAGAITSGNFNVTITDTVEATDSEALEFIPVLDEDAIDVWQLREHDQNGSFDARVGFRAFNTTGDIKWLEQNTADSVTTHISNLFGQAFTFKVFNKTDIQNKDISVLLQGYHAPSGIELSTSLTVRDGAYNRQNFTQFPTNAELALFGGGSLGSIGSPAHPFALQTLKLNASDINYTASVFDEVTVMLQLRDTRIGSSVRDEIHTIQIGNGTAQGGEISLWNFSNPDVRFTETSGNQTERGLVEVSSCTGDCPPVAFVPAPAQVTGLTVVQNMTNDAELDWDDIANTDNYEVFRDFNLIDNIWQYREVKWSAPSATVMTHTLATGNADQRTTVTSKVGTGMIFKVFPSSFLNNSLIIVDWQGGSDSGFTTITGNIQVYNHAYNRANFTEIPTPSTTPPDQTLHTEKVTFVRPYINNPASFVRTFDSVTWINNATTDGFSTVIVNLRDASTSIRPNMQLFSVNITDITTNETKAFYPFGSNFGTTITAEVTATSDDYGFYNVTGATIGTGLIGSPVESNFTDSTIGQTQVVNYTVRGVNSGGNGDFSDDFEFGLIQPITGLNATLSPTNKTTIELTWDLAQTVHPSDPLTGVRLERALASNQNLTYFDNMEDSSKWVSTDPNMQINETLSKLIWIATNDNTNEAIAIDLTNSSALGQNVGENFTLRFVVEWEQVSPNLFNNHIFFGLSDEDQNTNVGVGSEDFIGFHSRVKSGIDTSTGLYKDSSSSKTELNLLDPPIENETRYYEIIRDGTEVTWNAFSGSFTGTLISSVNATVPSTVQDLRYFKVSNWEFSDSFAPFDGFVDNLNITTTIPVTGIDFEFLANVDELDTMYNDTGLNETTTYNYRAKAFSALSTGAFDLIVNATTGGGVVTNQTESDIVTVLDDETFIITKSDSDLTTTSDVVSLKSPPFPITTLVASTVGNTCELSWSAPPTGGSPITKYQIFRAVSSGAFTLLLNQTFVNHTDTGLINNVLYEYNVTSINAFGDSEASNIENCMPIVSTVPNAPSLTDVNEEPNGDVTIDWIEPTEGSPTGYKIERRVGGGGFLVLVANTGNSLVTFTDTTTTPATQFTYRISGINAFGTGAFSNEGSITTASPPNAPLLTGEQNVNQIDISWTQPASANPINGYKIDRRINLGAFTTIVANTTTTDLNFTDINVTKPDTFGYRVRALSNAGEGTVSNIVDIIFGSHVVINVREQDGSFFKGGGIVKGVNSTFIQLVGLDGNSQAIFNNLDVGNFNYTFTDADDFILNKTFNFPTPSGNLTNEFTINALVFDVDCPANGLGTDIRIKVNYTDAKDITEFPSTPVCDSSDQVSWSTRWQGSAVNDTSTMVADFISTIFQANAEQFLASANIINTTFNDPLNKITSETYTVNMTDVTINFNLFLGRAPQTGGGGGSPPSSTPSSGSIPDPEIVFSERLTGLSILSRTHQFAQAGDVIEGTITVNWEGEDNLNVNRIDITNSDLDIRFDLPPFPLDQRIEGTGEFARSSAEIPYMIVLPPTECNVEMGITQNCFDPILHTLPIEFVFGLGEQEYVASTEVFVDGRPIPLDIVQLQIILLFLVLVTSAVFGNIIRRRFKKGKSRGRTTKKKFKKKFDSS